MFIIIRSASFSDLLQDIVVIVLILSMFSFWVPQILRNVIHNTRRGLDLYYVVGTSFTRLVIPLCKYMEVLFIYSENLCL